MIRSRWLLAVSVAGLGVVVVWAAAQTGAAGNPSQKQSGTSAQAGGAAGAGVLTFHANANLVLVDVVVRDKGKPVEGLKKSDFQVFEDGNPQTITTFEEHRATDVQEAAKAPPLSPHVYSDFPKYRVTSAANVLVLDALNTPLSDQSYARKQMLKVLHTIPPGTEIAVFTLASRLRMISGFTTDVGTIEQALNLKHTPGQKSIMTDPSGDLAEKEAEDEVEAEIPEMIREAEDFQQDRQAFQAQQRIDITLEASRELAQFLSTVPGRKNLIWVSGGLPIALDPGLSKLDTGTRYGQEVRMVNAELARSRVAVYPIDARALMTLPDANIANVHAPTESAGGVGVDLMAARAEAVNNDITVPQGWWATHSDMDEVARDTGGLAFYDTNAVGKAVEEAIADGSSYFTLAYAPHEDQNGTYHTIVVRLDEGKYDLQYRRGYYATDLREIAKETPLLSPMTAAMQPGVPPLSQLVFEARVLAAGDPELEGVQPSPGPAGKPTEPLTPPVTRYIIDYSIDPRGLELKTLPYGGKQAELEVTQAVYEPGGKRLNSTDAGLEVTQTAEEMARDMRNGLRVRQEIDVPAGNVVLRLGVRDATSGRIGTVEVAVGQATGNSGHSAGSR